MKFFRDTLVTKILVFFIPVSLVLSFVVLFLMKQIVHTVLLKEIQKRVLTKAQDVAEALVDDVGYYEEFLLLPSLQMLKERLAADYALVLNNYGKVVAHTNVVERGKTYEDAVTLETLRRSVPGSVTVNLDKRHILDVSFPILEKPQSGDDFLLADEKNAEKHRLGTLRVGIPFDETMRLENKIFFQQLIPVLIAIIISSSGLIIFIMRTVLTPVSNLVAGVSEISHGDFGKTIPVLSGDEIGKLAHAFNGMSSALASTTVSKNYLDAILANMLDPLFVLNPDRSIKSANASTYKLFGYSENELIGSPVEQLFGREQKVLYEKLLERYWQPDTIIKDVELAFAAKSGEMIPVMFSSVPLKDEQGENTGIICVARDIRERRMLEARMLQSEKLSAVGQLAAGVAHEVNNPMGVILGFAQSLAKQVQQDTPFFIPVKSIEREALRCKNLVQNLLMFSRQTGPKTEVFEFNTVIGNALSLVQTQCRVKSVELIQELQECGEMQGDRNQVQQILINLCNNAVDAMSDGGQLQVRTALQKENGNSWIALEVKDSGVGIPETIREKIFEPFFTTKEPGKGTGLGLALVHEMVVKNSGVIDVKSEVGEGTVFTVRFPKLKHE